MEGTIARLTTKGFGFIRASSGKEYFFHATDMLSRLDFSVLKEGQTVAFEELASPKGPKAVSVEIV